MGIMEFLRLMLGPITSLARSGHEKELRLACIDLEPKACAPEGGIGRRTAKVLGEAGHILKARPDLLRVEIDRHTPETNHVQRTASGKRGAVLHAECCGSMPTAKAARGPWIVAPFACAGNASDASLDQRACT